MGRLLKILLGALVLAALLAGCQEAPQPTVEHTAPPAEETTAPPTAETTAPPTTAPVLTGWQTLDGRNYYYDETGAPQTGWLELEGERYYLDPEGVALTGWQEIGQHRFFFGKDGAMYRGWLELGDDRYYLKDNGVMAIGRITLDGVNHFFTSQGKYVLLVNAWNPVPEDYDPQLVTMGSHQVSAVCAEALRQMVDDCLQAGYDCGIDSIYRSKETQQALWDNAVSSYLSLGYSYADANAYTGRAVAIPGHSEHQTGLAVDIEKDYEPALRWVAQYCHEYGFILRYSVDKTEYTGIIYEPWHFRYVGVELATELTELGLCMEEYMEMLTEQEAAKPLPY